MKEHHSGALFQEKELFTANSLALSGIMRIFAADKTFKLHIMATVIRENPVLKGQSAIDFLNEADKYAERPVPRLPLQREQELSSFKDAHKHFAW